MSVPRVKLGHSAIEISQLGYGAMGLTSGYSTETGVVNNFVAVYVPTEKDYERGDAAISAAYESGVNFVDTADVYGGGGNEKLVGSAIRKLGRENVVVATKFMLARDEEGKVQGLSGGRENVLATAERSLKNLGVDTIDLYYQHRVDPSVPIEETVAAMAELVAAGKVRALGLSEAPAAVIRRAHAVHPISAVQVEYSLWTRLIERNDVLATCRELGITVVAYSPVGRGMLTGKFKKPEDISDSDWRKTNPRFQGENFERNVAAVGIIEEIAAARGVTASQVALAWLFAQGNDIVPIPGSSNPVHIHENSKAHEIKLTAEEIEKLNGLEALVVGARYDESAASLSMDNVSFK